MPGVYRIAGGRIAEVRDYVDLGVWRDRLGTVMSRPGGKAQGS